MAMEMIPTPFLSLPIALVYHDLRTTDQNVVDGDVDELDDVTDSSHDEETNTDGLRELLVLGAIGLGAPPHELDAILSELRGDLKELLNGIGHCNFDDGQRGRRELIRSSGKA